MPYVIRLFNGETLPNQHWHDLEPELARACGLTVEELRASIERERAEGRTLAAIASGLNEDEVPTALKGRAWHAKTIANIVKRIERAPLERDAPPFAPSAWGERVVTDVESLLDERERE
jgi:hypothetical protein